MSNFVLRVRPFGEISGILHENAHLRPQFRESKYSVVYICHYFCKRRIHSNNKTHKKCILEVHVIQMGDFHRYFEKKVVLRPKWWERGYSIVLGLALFLRNNSRLVWQKYHKGLISGTSHTKVQFLEVFHIPGTPGAYPNGSKSNGF